MDFLTRISSYFSELYQSAYCYFNSDAAACAAPQSAAPTDQYQRVELREIQLHELIEQSRPAQVGCYIQMHRVPDYDALRRQVPATTPRK